jgi:uridylate kinase
VSSRRYNRVLLKLSGNCFENEDLLDRIIRQIAAARRWGVRFGIVMGGGNILRGRDSAGSDRAVADKAGMMATVVNGLRLAERLGRRLPAVHFSAVGIPGTVPAYDLWRARAELERGSVLVLSGGTGNPFFSTDSAAALRAAELGMDVLLKGTRVAGVYSADPEKNPGAKLYRRISYEAALAAKLNVMDLTAFALAMDRRIPIVVFDIGRAGAITDILKGKRIGSLIC